MDSKRFSAPSIELLRQSDRKSLATVLTKITVFCTYPIDTVAYSLFVYLFIYLLCFTGPTEDEENDFKIPNNVFTISAIKLI